ncbi:MAG: hypothetical protein JW723_11370 [Bacteroidales bacterium]|nr:hypothetical protein [Bacteroidales bacterium]
MKAIDLLATSLNRRDDKPNQDLAVEIIKSKRHDWLKELVDNLHHKDKNIQSDCIKVLYEIGECGSADMIAPYYNDFGQILKSKNNRLVWGAMTALDMIASINPEGIYDLLPLIMSAVDNGSVITVDHGVGILSKLAGLKEYSDSAFPLLMEQLRKCPPKQLPMYAEKAMLAINTENKKQLLDLIESRLSEMDKESQKARLRRIIKRLNSKQLLPAHMLFK